MRVWRAGPRFYAAPAGQVRVRRATDIVVLASCLIALAGLVAAQPPGPFERSLLAFLETFPDWLAPVWGFLTGLLVLWSVLMLVAPLVTRRPRITFEAVLAIAVALVVGLLAARSASGQWPGGEAALGLDNALQFPSVRLAAAAALITVVNAQVSRPFGSMGRWLVLLGTVGAVMNGRATITGAVAALLTGLAAGAAVRLALGTSAGRPSLDEIRAELEALGVGVHDLVSAERQTAGVYLVYGKDADGRRPRHQGLRPRRVRQPAPRPFVAGPLVSRCRIGGAREGASRRARGAVDALCAQRRRAGPGGRHGRRFGRRGHAHRPEDVRPAARRARCRGNRRRAAGPLLGGPRSARAGARRPSADQSLVDSHRARSGDARRSRRGRRRARAWTNASPTRRSSWPRRPPWPGSSAQCRQR